MLLPFYSIGSNAISIEKRLTSEFFMHFDPVYVARPGMKLPFIQTDSFGKIIPGIWGIPSLKGSPEIWYTSEGIIKNKNTRIGIRRNRCLIPSNGFFLSHQKKYYFIYSPDEPVITLAGIYNYRKRQEASVGNYHFAILIRDANSRLAGLTSRIPVIISTGSRRKYLNSEKPLMDITHLLHRETRLKLNGIEVLQEILIKGNPGKADFYRQESRLFPEQKFPEKEILGSYYYF
jgi:putative SOS response-associated peptidase YedK